MLTLYLSVIDTEPGRELFAELYRSMRQPLYRCAFGYLDNASDAEDAVHDVFLNIAERGMDDLTRLGEAERKRFLYVCVRNRAIDMIRRRGKVVSMDELAEEGMTIPDGGEDILESLLEGETLGAAKEAMKKLDPQLADALWLHLSGRTAAQIAADLGEKEQTVKKRLYRGKLALREIMGKEAGA